MGYTFDELAATLRHIERDAPVVIHVRADQDLAQFLKDMKYRSRFETGKGRGCSDMKQRESWERALFDGAYDGCIPSERPKYGVLNIAGSLAVRGI